MKIHFVVSLVFFSVLCHALPAFAGFSAATSHGKASGCTGDAFFDPRNGGECWSCPAGYNRTAYGVDSDKACVDQAISKASYEGKSGCTGSSFYDPRKGGECWKCPSNRPRRTAYPVTNSKACATKEIIGEKLSKAKFVKKTGCKSPQFYDPRKGGECWTCPDDYKRTAAGVTKSNACQKEILKRASFENKFVCPSDQFFDPGNGGECWSCPDSKKYRTINPVTSQKACTDEFINILAADTTAICRQVVGAFNEGKKGVELLSTQFSTLIDPVRKPVADELSKLSKNIKSPAKLDEIYENVSKHLSPELTDELLRLQDTMKKAAGNLDKVLLDPDLMCGGDLAKIDKRLSQLGLRPDLGPGKSSALEDFFFPSAHAYSGQGIYSAYSIGFAVPLGVYGNWNFAFSLVTNFNGAGGAYFNVGQYVSTSGGPSGSVGMMIYPVASLASFDSSPVPGAQISFGAGKEIENFFKQKAGPRGSIAIPNSLDIAFDPAFRSVPGFGVSKGIGGEGNKLLDLTGSIGFTFPLSVWGR